jgi:hypothetical protein
MEAASRARPGDRQRGTVAPQGASTFMPPKEDRATLMEEDDAHVAQASPGTLSREEHSPPRRETQSEQVDLS